VFGTVLQKLLRLGKFVLLAGRLFHILISRLLKRYACLSVVVFKFREIGRREIGESVHYLPDRRNILPASQTVATARIAPKIYQGQPPTIFSECSRFPPNRLTFSGVVAERMNTAKSRPKVNPIFGGSYIASSRIIMSYFHSVYTVWMKMITITCG